MSQLIIFIDIKSFDSITLTEDKYSTEMYLKYVYIFMYCTYFQTVLRNLWSVYIHKQVI